MAQKPLAPHRPTSCVHHFVVRPQRGSRDRRL